MNKLHIFLITVMLLFGCKSAPFETTENYPFLGTWIYESSIADTTIMKRASELDSTNTGYIFYRNGKLIERKIAGWCHTPPVSYGNYEGNWILISNNTIKINVAKWNGTEKYNLIIIAVNDKELKFIKRYEDG